MMDIIQDFFESLLLSYLIFFYLRLFVCDALDVSENHSSIIGEDKDYNTENSLQRFFLLNFLTFCVRYQIVYKF